MRLVSPLVKAKEVKRERKEGEEEKEEKEKALSLFNFASYKDVITRFF